MAMWLNEYNMLVEKHPTKIFMRLILTGSPHSVHMKILKIKDAAVSALLQKTKAKADKLNMTAANELKTLRSEVAGDEELAAALEDAIQWHTAAAAGAHGGARRGRRAAAHREPGTPVPPRPGRPRGPLDETAKSMLGLSLDEMYAYAASELGVPELILRDRYTHLNPGLQRMNLGNKVRAKKIRENRAASEALQHMYNNFNGGQDE